MNPHRSAAARPLLVVPAYFHPAVRAGDWDRLVTLARRVRLVVLNLASGPGERRDEAFGPVLARIRDARVTVAGYVDTDYGRRPPGAALADLERYQSWYGVDGVFFDRVSVGAEHVARYRALAESVRRHGAGVVAFNHGAQPVPAYAEHADLLGTFEGPWHAYLDAAVPHWVRASAAHRFFHLVHSVPHAHLGDALDLAGKRNAGGVYATNQGGGNPWDRLPGDPVDAGNTDR
ncbi:spherulation-specific family 4 protein [Planosporangium sp. 12N6]|uniref:spherulation-specific family 4 protein n=1 Tax=Planosporangium spinosum TaxID=3402278 RepID=UPI003CF835BD